MKLGPFKGMNNLAADHALPKGSKEDPRAAVRNAVNADIDNAGKWRLREGMVKRYSSIAMKDGFSCSLGNFAVELGILKRIDTSTWTGTALMRGITGDTFAFHEFNGSVFFSDGTKTAKITDGAVTGWGMNNPPAPVVYTGTGIFGAGLYMCALTYVDALGNESGASDISRITASDNSSFVFINLPSPQDSQVVATRIYLSTANGNVLYQCAEVANGVSTTTILLDYDGGKELQTGFLTKPPVGQIIREFNGRMLIAFGPYLYFTEPYSNDLVSQLSKDKLYFGDDITVVEPVVDGVWVVAGSEPGKTYFLAGGTIETFQQITKLDYGAVLGTGQQMPNSKLVTWFSTRGLIVAGNGGEIKNVQEDNVAPDVATRGTMMIRESNGIIQAVVNLKDATMSTRAATSFIDAETIRRAG
jgi:hypothetical protein